MAATASSSAAFTRLESLTVLLMLLLLVSLAWPVLAGQRARSERAVCSNNLRQVGQAFRIWASEHGDLNPWLLEYTGWLKHSKGGTRNHPLGQEAWLHFSWVSNELHTPAVLACPADASVRVATDFGAASGRGFLNRAFAGRAVSYVISAHSRYDDPQSLLSGDRNVRPSSLEGCSYNLVLPGWREGANPPSWTNALHGLSGNLLFSDGRVTEASGADLLSSVARSPNAFNTNVLHVFYPR